MKSYLTLVSEYAKVHKKKNRLTVICIAISVMLVTAVFGMADMSLKAQTDEAIRRYYIAKRQFPLACLQAAVFFGSQFIV